MEEKKSKTAVTNTDSAADDNGKPKSVQKSNSEKTAAAIVKPKKSGPKKKHTSKNKYETKEISSSPVTKEVSEPEKTPEIIELHAEIQGGTEKQSVKSVEPDLKQEQTVKTVEISVGTSPEIENNDQKDNTSDISADPKESPLTVNDRTNESNRLDSEKNALAESTASAVEAAKKIGISANRFLNAMNDRLHEIKHVEETEVSKPLPVAKKLSADKSAETKAEKKEAIAAAESNKKQKEFDKEKSKKTGNKHILPIDLKDYEAEDKHNTKKTQTKSTRDYKESLDGTQGISRDELKEVSSAQYDVNDSSEQIVRHEFRKMLSAPDWCMEDTAKSTVYEWYHPLMLILTKWAASLAVLAYVIFKAVNQYQYSFVRMTFTDAVWLWLRLLILAMMIELLSSWLFSFISSRWYSKVPQIKILSVQAESSITIGAFNIIAGVMLAFNPIIGLSCIIGAGSFAIVLIIDGYQLASKINRRQLALVNSLVCFASSFAAWIWIWLTCTDLLKIIANILNL